MNMLLEPGCLACIEVVYHVMHISVYQWCKAVVIDFVAIMAILW